MTGRDLARAELRARLKRGRSAVLEPEPDKTPVMTALLATDYHRMAAEYWDALADVLPPDEFAVFVYQRRLDEFADVGHWERVAARLFYRLEEFEGRTLAEAVELPPLVED